MEFELIVTKSYDTHHSYGTDWHTDYVFKCDKPDLNVREAIELLESHGLQPFGEITLSYNKEDKQYTLGTVMY